MAGTPGSVNCDPGIQPATAQIVDSRAEVGELKLRAEGALVDLLPGATENVHRIPGSAGDLQVDCAVAGIGVYLDCGLVLMGDPASGLNGVFCLPGGREGPEFARSGM